VIALSEGLAVNPVLRVLSLTYCGIDSQGAEALFEILIYSRSALEEVNLSGNLLMNEGIVFLLRGVAIAKSLKKILVADNQFNDDEDVMKAIEFCMRKNERLGKYDFKFNNIGEQGLIKLTEILKNQPHVSEVEVPEKVESVEEKEVFEAFRK